MSSTMTKTTKYTYRSGQGADINVEYHHDHSNLARLEVQSARVVEQSETSIYQDKIRLLHEDLDNERELRQRIEREKADLSVQVIQLTERLEESEGTVEGQLDMNRKRDGELTKLRKLLEDVHLESEETAHMLRKKHQEAMADLQDQLDAALKMKQKIEKDKNKLQAEIYELLAQVESTTKDKITYQKAAEKLEIHVHELNIKIEELNRNITDVTAIRARLSTENIELVKEVQELKVNIENITYLKSTIASQLDDTKRRLEEEERRRSMLEASLHTVEIELESVRVQLEEESEARLDLERQLQKANGDIQVWRSKYETEAQARVEEVEEIRKKFTIRITEMEEHIESLTSKVAALEKQKSRLQSEVEVLIIDLEKANGTARDLQKRVDHLEKLNIDLNNKLSELSQLYEQAQRDLRNKASEIQRLTMELEKTREAKELLTRENKKLGDELHECKGTLADVTKRYHELEIECRRLENEREELSHAYKEAEAGRKAEEARAQRLTSDINQLRHDYEKALTAKEEELEGVRKSMSLEIEQLNIRIQETEVRMKTEITRIKKKMQVQITELEMSLDVANKNNIELQKTIKKQSLQLTELAGQYDELQRQLQVTLDQLGVSQRRVQALTAELEDMRGNLEAAMRAKRAVEVSLEETITRVNELTTINVNISSAKAKLEQEFAALSNDYDELTKELKMADDRVQKSQAELKHTIDILHEEQERVVKIETIKKSLEIEVKNLTIRLEEVEANAIVGGKRVISKLEARIRDLEMELDEEKRKHAESIKLLRKKERHVKEVLLQCEEDSKNLTIFQETVDKLTAKINIYKRQLQETEGLSAQNLTRVRRFQRELEAAEDRAECAESNLSMIRAKHRSFVTSSQAPGMSQTYIVEEHHTREAI